MGHILRAQFVGDKGLAAVQAVVAGEHKADTAAQRDELQPGAAEQLKAQQDGGDQDVGGTAEDYTEEKESARVTAYFCNLDVEPSCRFRIFKRVVGS